MVSKAVCLCAAWLVVVLVLGAGAVNPGSSRVRLRLHKAQLTVNSAHSSEGGDEEAPRFQSLTERPSPQKSSGKVVSSTKPSRQDPSARVASLRPQLQARAEAAEVKDKQAKLSNQQQQRQRQQQQQRSQGKPAVIAAREVKPESAKQRSGTASTNSSSSGEDRAKDKDRDSDRDSRTEDGDDAGEGQSFKPSGQVQDEPEIDVGGDDKDTRKASQAQEKPSGSAAAGPVTVLDNFNSVEDDGPRPSQPTKQQIQDIKDAEQLSSLQRQVVRAKQQVSEMKKQLSSLAPMLPVKRHTRIKEDLSAPKIQPRPQVVRKPAAKPKQKAPARKQSRIKQPEERKLMTRDNKPETKHKTTPIDKPKESKETEKKDERKRPVPLKEHPTENKPAPQRASRFDLKRAEEFLIDAAHSLALSYVDGDAGQTVRAVREAQAASASGKDCEKELKVQEALAKDEVDKREIVVKAQQAEQLREMSGYQLKDLANLQPGSRVVAGQGKLIRVDVARFESIVKDSSKPSVVVVGPLYGCGFCKMLYSKVTKAAEKIPQVVFLHLVSDLHGVLEVEQQLKPAATGVYPHIWSFRNGKVRGLWNEDKDEPLLKFAQRLL